MNRSEGAEDPARAARGLTRLLRPRSVAVVGASPTPGALGASVLANLDRFGFGGDVHLINPRRAHIGARPCLKAVAELPLGVDVAVLAIPRAAVLETLAALAQRQVGAAIIFSAGFAEGGAAGAAEQREIARIAESSGMAIEGPNCLGLVNYVDGVALTFIETPAVLLGDRPGIGLVSQSGAMAAVVGVTLQSRGLGLSWSVSTGNEAVSGVEDYLEHLLQDAHTSVIALIVEQFRQPQRFLAQARRARELGKPIVLLHPGRSAAARASAATHTGAMAGDYEVMRTQVTRAGVRLAGDLEEFGDMLELAARCPRLPAGGTALLAESGAFKALALDVCEQIGLALPPLDDASAPLLRAALPAFVPVSNPVDLTAQGLVEPDLYRRALAALLQDERFGCIVLTLIQTDAHTSAIKFPPVLAALRELQPDKPVICAGLDEGAAVPQDYIAQLRALHVPYFPTPNRALRAVARMQPGGAASHEAAGAEVLRFPAASPRGGTQSEYQSKRLLQPLGFAFPPGRLVRTLAEAQQAAAELGWPVALKAQSAALPHKTEAGGVVLGLEDADAIARGWAQLHASLARHRPDLELDGVLVEKMGARGVEMIVGGRNDPQWGAVVLAGFGGVQAEIARDVRLLPADLDEAGVLRELDLLRGSPLLRGYRGSPALDVPALATLIRRVGGLLRGEPGLREIDLNPVVLHPHGQGVVALDALLVFGSPPA
ncbi:MAG TPA: acetate--CoA ligase family protein [Steroidobacteraceae bacterium]|nr:acetate--CoA ligase family protein [Steroidobacteraceae bacterium]